jgi:hypothetical protein
MGWDTFIQEVWERKPCVISGRRSDHYADVLTLADMDAIVSVSESGKTEHSVDIVRYGENGQQDGSVPRTAQELPDLRHVYRAYDDGYSIKINGVHRRWGPIARLCNALQRRLHHPVGGFLFLTPAQAQAVAPHLDGYDTFLLQIDGVKHWRVYEPTVSLPLSSMAGAVERSQLGRPVVDVDLEAGDLLYIPRGFIHEGLTADVSSLHLTLAVRVTRWVHVLEHAIALAAQRDVRLREAVPAGYLESDEAAEAMGQRFHDLLRQVLDDVPFDDLRTSLLGTFTDHQQVPLDGHFASLDRLRSLDAHTIVRRRTGMLCSVTRDDGQAMIWFSGVPVGAPVTVEPALRFIAETERFAIRDLPDCLTEKGKGVLVRRLIREGLLAVEGGGGAHAAGALSADSAGASLLP